MSSKTKELKEELLSLQAEIVKAKAKVEKAEEKLEKAIEEGKADTILSVLKCLYEGASAFLTGLQREKEELLKRETKLIRLPSLSEDEIVDSSKRRKVDEIIEKCKKFLFHTDQWGCVTVISKRRAVTFAHNEHRLLKSKDDISKIKVDLRGKGKTEEYIESETMKYVSNIEIYSINSSSLETSNSVNNYFNTKAPKYKLTVEKTNSDSDWVLLKCDVDLCDKEPFWDLTVDGLDYIQLGLSAITQNDSPFSVSKGVISSSRLNRLGHILGSAGANPGDSGGGCFHVSNGSLIGINVGSEKVSINPEKDTITETYNKVSSRYAARAHIIPISIFFDK